MTQLGRISGPILNSNLLRDGNDLAFDTDLLYLKISPIIVPWEQDGEVGDPNYDSSLPASMAGTGIGINTDTPVVDLDINSFTKTSNLIVDNQAIFDNLIFNANGTVSTVVGPINISPVGAGAVINLDRVLTAQLEINGNAIKNYTTNGSVVLNPNASGSINIQNNTSILGNLTVTGNTILTGDLSAVDNIIVGDSPLDVVVVAPDFTQDIIPGIDNSYDLGQSVKRWSQLHVADDLTHADLVLPQAVIISDQMRLDGVTGQIISVQSNDDIRITPFTGITSIERTQWQINTVTNLNNSAITIASTGIGYSKFVGTNGFVMPAGTGDDTYAPGTPQNQRRANPEEGETRWNTDLQYVECYDGTVWQLSTGGGATISVPVMQDLGNVYSLILG
jgi:hypothetical protein